MSAIQHEALRRNRRPVFTVVPKTTLLAQNSSDHWVYVAANSAAALPLSRSANRIQAPKSLRCLLLKNCWFCTRKMKEESLTDLDRCFWKSFPGWWIASTIRDVEGRLEPLAWHWAEEQPPSPGCCDLGALAEGWHFKDTWEYSEQFHELGEKMSYKAE